MSEFVDQPPQVDTSKQTGWLVLTAQVISLVFSPFYLSVVAFVALFLFSYLNLLPWTTKLILTLIVYFFTILLPHFSIYLYRKLNGWTRHELGMRERRYVPYILSIISHFALFYLFYRLHMPRFTLGVIVGALSIQIVCAFVNGFLKVSTHAAYRLAQFGNLVMRYGLYSPFDSSSTHPSRSGLGSCNRNSMRLFQYTIHLTLLRGGCCPKDIEAASSFP